jgi:hypothetical protein
MVEGQESMGRIEEWDDSSDSQATVRATSTKRTRAEEKEYFLHRLAGYDEEMRDDLIQTIWKREKDFQST